MTTITAPSIHQALTFVLDHLPERMHVILATRIDPPLPLSRLRVLGQKLALRAADLRLTPEEAAAFLREVMGLDLSAAEVATLEARTEGWIAGLQLAALSLQGRSPAGSPVGPRAGLSSSISACYSGKIAGFQAISQTC